MKRINELFFMDCIMNNECSIKLNFIQSFLSLSLPYSQHPSNLFYYYPLPYTSYSVLSVSLNTMIQLT